MERPFEKIEIEADAERPPLAGDDQRAGGGVGLQMVQQCLQIPQPRFIDRVQPAWDAEGGDGDPLDGLKP